MFCIKHCWPVLYSFYKDISSSAGMALSNVDEKDHKVGGSTT